MNSLNFRHAQREMRLKAEKAHDTGRISKEVVLSRKMTRPQIRSKPMYDSGVSSSRIRPRTSGTLVIDAQNNLHFRTKGGEVHRFKRSANPEVGVNIPYSDPKQARFDSSCNSDKTMRSLRPYTAKPLIHRHRNSTTAKLDVKSFASQIT